MNDLPDSYYFSVATFVVLLIYGTRMYTVIPKRAFVDAEQRARFMELVGQHVGKAASAGA